jgi:gliding motility-associated-like protein
MARVIYIVILLFIFNKCIGQSSSCIDSVSFTKYVPPFYAGATFVSEEDFIFLDNEENTFLTASGLINNSLSKFDNNKQLLWYRYYRTTNVFSQAYLERVWGIDNEDNLVVKCGSGNAYRHKFPIGKIHGNTGTFLWAKEINNLIDPNTSLQHNIAIKKVGYNNEIYIAGSYSNIRNESILVCLDKDGNPLWNITLSDPALPNMVFGIYSIVPMNSNEIAVFASASDGNLPNNNQALVMLKINAANGNIILQKAINYYNDVALTNQNYGFILRTFNYNPISKKFIVNSHSGLMPSHVGDIEFFTVLDENFEIIKSKRFISNLRSYSNFDRTHINKDNIINITMGREQTATNTTLKYTTLNENLDLVAQKKINLAALGISPMQPYDIDMRYKKNNVLSFFLSKTYTFSLPTEGIYMFENVPFYNNGVSPCLGYDTTMFTEGAIYTKPVTHYNLQNIRTLPLTTTALTPDLPLSFTYPKQTICSQVSICDAIQLQPLTPAQKCLSQPLDSFKVLRSPQCLRKTQWQVDTTAMQILNSNDTMLYVKYLHSYSGNITVTYGGCSLSSSTAITVSTPKTGLFIGNDVVLCTDSAITLNAGTGFKTYAWSIGFGTPTITVTQPGKYWVTAIDSCNNLFSDTINILPTTAKLNVSFTDTICQYDTAFITLPNDLYNYSWQPSTFSYLKANTILSLYPKTNTIYTIKGNASPNCVLTDTVLIRTKYCPQYIYFPTAFTPNGDGLNDVYKPTLTGAVVYYEFTVFDRWGNRIFSTTTPNKGWDGRTKNGAPLMGSYVYTCRYKFYTKKEEVENGTFVLIR